MATANKVDPLVERGPDRRTGDERRDAPHDYAGDERRSGDERREEAEAEIAEEPYTGAERRKHPRRIILDRRG